MSAAEKLDLPRRNRGAYLLARTGATQAAIASVAGVSQPMAKRWLDSTAKPTMERRALIAARWPAVYVASFDEMHGAELPDLDTSNSRTAPPATAPMGAGVTGEVVPDLEVPRKLVAVPDSIDGRIELVERMLRRLLEKADAETDAAPLESAKLLAAATTTLHKLAAMKGELDITRRVLTLPAFKRAVTAVETALRGHPAAAEAVERALHTLHETS